MINKKRKRKYIISGEIILFVVLLAVLAYVTLPLISNIRKQGIINKEIKDLENEIVDLDKKNSDLNKMLKYLESDQFVFDQARANLNYKKKDEKVVIIHDDNGEKLEEVGGGQIFEKFQKTQKKSFKDSNMYKWLNYFIKR